MSRSDSLALLFQEALTVVARIRAGRQRLGEPEVFRTQMGNALAAAQKTALAYGYPANDLETVLQTITAFLDESLLNANSPQYTGLGEEACGVHRADENFLRNLDGLFERPDSLTVADVLEVHQICLLLGFRTHLSGLEIRCLLRGLEERIRRIRNARPAPQRFHMYREGVPLESQTVTFLLGAAGTGKTSLVSESGLKLEQATENAWRVGEALLVDGGPIANRRLFRRSDACSAMLTLDCGTFVTPERVEALARSARECREMLAEIARATRATLPIYVVFTKADKLNYFSAFARNIEEPESHEPMGSSIRGSVGQAFDEVYRTLADKRTTLLERERDIRERPNIFEFPREFAKLRPLILEFLAELRGPANILRGFYFTGTATHSDGVPQRLWLRGLLSGIVRANTPMRKPPGKSRGPISISRLAGMR